MAAGSWSARVVGAAGWVAALFGGLGFAASLGRGALPELAAGWVLPVHLALLAAGLGAAWTAAVRGAEIDRERFAFVTEPLVTRDEMKLAHREAEQQHRWSTTVLVAAPLLLGYWLAYELPAGSRWGRAVPVAALAGFALGSLLFRRRRSALPETG